MNVDDIVRVSLLAFADRVITLNQDDLARLVDRIRLDIAIIRHRLKLDREALLLRFTNNAILLSLDLRFLET